MPGNLDPTDVTGKRVGAWVIDGVIYTVLANILGAIFGTAVFKSYDLTGVSSGDRFCDVWRQTNSGFCTASNETAFTVVDFEKFVILFLGLFIAYCVVQGLLGGSLGKLSMGLRIVKRDGSQAGIGASFIRTAMWIVDSLPCVPLVGLITLLSSKGHRRVGDMAAGTYVVSANQVGHPVILPGEAGYGRIPPGAHPGAYGVPQTNPIQTYIPGGGTDPFGQPFDTPPASTPSQAPTTSSQYEADAPTWDVARNTYIKYDSAQSAWLELDQATQLWKPIST